MRKNIAVWTGKAISLFTRSARLGGGSAAPGLYALKIDPDLVGELSSKIGQNIIITGTNGKTTTARLLYNFAKSEGLKVIRNSTGSNMERGIASELIGEANVLAKVPNFDLGIWEIDEATLKIIAPKLKPQIIIFLNAARDQLDRYGELDSLIREWREGLEKIDYSPLILINGDDANTYALRGINGLGFETFGTDEKLVKWEKQAFNPKLDFKAVNISQKGLKGLSFRILFNSRDDISINFPLPGIYHVYDILASFAAGYQLNLSTEMMSREIANYSPVFGRVERIKIRGKESFIFLIKNPTGATEVFKTIKDQVKKSDSLLLALNDNLADGRDVSWIWDADFEVLSNVANLTSNIICSGKRAEDLALRLKYAGVDEKKLTCVSNLKQALNQSLDSSKKLFILPTYTALLELQKILAKMGVKKHYWEEIN